MNARATSYRKYHPVVCSYSTEATPTAVFALICYCEYPRVPYYLLITLFHTAVSYLHPIAILVVTRNHTAAPSPCWHYSVSHQTYHAVPSPGWGVKTHHHRKYKKKCCRSSTLSLYLHHKVLIPAAPSPGWVVYRTIIIESIEKKYCTFTPL